MPSKKPHRTTGQDPAETPVVLPHVVITATVTGALDVTVDGTAFPPPEEGIEWTRRTFGTLLDAITEDRRIAVRIEVRETDGSVFTDLIHARRPTPVEPEEDKSEIPRGKQAKTKRKKRPELVEVTAEGFVPGEDITIAVVVSHTEANSSGYARALLDTAKLGSVLGEGAGEVVLLGRVSGTVHVSGPS